MKMHFITYDFLKNIMQSFRIIKVTPEFFVSFTLTNRPYQPFINFGAALFKTLIYRINNIRTIFINGIIRRFSKLCSESYLPWLIRETIPLMYDLNLTHITPIIFCFRYR